MFLQRIKHVFSTMQKFIQSREQCLQSLKELEVPFKLYEHDAVKNMTEMTEKVKLEKGPLIKNLFYADKKPNQYYFIIAEKDTKVDKGFWKNFGTTNNNVRLAKQQHVVNVLKSKFGAVNPFCLFNDENKQVKYLIIDENLYDFDVWAFHPMDNSATVEVSKNDFLKILDTWKVTYAKANLSESKEQPKKQQKKKQQQKEQVNLLGIQAKKNQQFANWYPQVIIKSGMLDYYDVSGCYILKPWAYGIWERIQRFFDELIKENGVQNAYFPMFVSKKALQTEKQHVEGFAAEVAWVTKSGSSDLNEPIAIRPTSQTIMYPAFANWIKSHRDLPLKINQWTNIVRWEFKHPTPFIRTRQFLWQQGHTAHTTQQQAMEEALTNLQFYRRVYEQLLAVPVKKGIKTQSEKFAGGYKTTTVETWIPENGRAIQAATSHNLGQNFAKMFKIQFQDDKKQKRFAWQTSWGLTTRSLGIMVMYHGDDKGLVLPPKVANYQIIIVPIPFKGKQEAIFQAAKQLHLKLKKSNLRCHLDDRPNYNPGWKYNHWQLKGVPIRLQLGPKDIQKGQVRCVLRYNGQKLQLKQQNLDTQLSGILEKIQNDMYQIALQKFNSKLKQASTWENFMGHLNNRNVVLTPWCEDMKCEEKIKERSGLQTKQGLFQAENNTLTGQAKTLCVPLQYEALKQGQKCFHCGQAAKVKVIWGRSY